MELKGAEIFATGRHNGIDITEAQLDGIEKSFDALDLGGRIPLKFGHEGDDARDGAPALGWVERVYREGHKLLADFTDIPKAVYDAIKAGLYKFVSVELLRDVKAGTREIPYVLDAVALLGATPPAVGTLRDLQSLTMRRGPPLQFGARLSFSRDDTEALRTENARLHEQLLRQTQDTDVTTGRVVAAERVRFDRRYRDAPELRTAENWKAWVADCPPVKFRRGEQPPGRAVDTGDNMRPDSRPDVELARLAEIEFEKHGGRLTFSQCSILVMKRDPQLAEAYRSQPGVKE